MTLNLFWKIQFAALKTGTIYTASVFKEGSPSSPYPLTLFGGASPFTTEEDASADMFAPIRTQSGYLRIVDNGKDVNGNTLPSGWWKDFVPTNETNRPVVLSHVRGNTTVIDWVGFLQPQTFGSQLYIEGQEREYPIQCPLSILNGIDMPTTNLEIQNFGYLLKLCLDKIPELCRPTSIVIQGGTDAAYWLLKRIDWQNFVDTDAEDELTGKYKLYQCLSDMCQFWGWTARMQGKTLYLTCADDNVETYALVLTYDNLTAIAGGSLSGTTETMFTTVALSGNIFASINNEDAQLNGYSKAIVHAEGSAGQDELTGFMPQSIEDYLIEQTPTTETYGNKTIKYYGSLMQFPGVYYPNLKSPLLKGSASYGYAKFSYGSCEAVKASGIRITHSYFNDSAVLASLETVMEHNFYSSFSATDIDRGGFQIRGDVYQKAARYEDYIVEAGDETFVGIGIKSMVVRFGVGKTRQTAIWYNGLGWQETVCTFRLTVGNQDNILHPCTAGTTPVFKFSARNHISLIGGGRLLEGKIFFDLLGSDELPVEVNSQRSFFLANLAIEFSKTKDYENKDNVENNKKGNSDYEYVASSPSNSGREWNADLAYASDNNMTFGYGVIINPDGTLMETAVYGSNLEHPEQHLANRVAAQWATVRRNITADLFKNAIPAISPRNLVTLDGTTMHPVSISHEWRDDVTRISFIEIPTT